MISLVYLISPIFFGVYILLEIWRGRFNPPQASREETFLDVLAWFQSWFIVGPLLMLGLSLIAQHLLPEHAGIGADLPWYVQLGAFIIADDLVQYLWHRSCHTFPLMWRLHKLHHSAPYMGVRIVWRNSLLHNLLMPNLWFTGVLLYLGFGEVYVGYQIVRVAVAMGAHSEIRWDEFLYRYRVLAPVAWLIERVFSTPATHFAHHAATEADGIGRSSGNYGNMLFIWDMLFGTAHITRRYPERFGLDHAGGEPKDPWYVLVLYPLFRSEPTEQWTESQE